MKTLFIVNDFFLEFSAFFVVFRRFSGRGRYVQLFTGARRKQNSSKRLVLVCIFKGTRSHKSHSSAENES